MYWRSILWTDEAKSEAYCPNRKYVHCRKLDRFKKQNLAFKVKFGKWSAMTYAGISYDHRTELVVLEKGTTKEEQFHGEFVNNLNK